MSQATNYDVIVIGTSQGGRFLPIAYAKAGRKVALIERGQLGGVCVNVGCTPTKTMVASARVAYLARCTHRPHLRRSAGRAQTQTRYGRGRSQ